MHISFYKRPRVILFVLYALVLAIFLNAPKQENSFEQFADVPLSLKGEVISYPTYKNGKTNFVLKLTIIKKFMPIVLRKNVKTF